MHRGSMQYWHRRRASHRLPRLRAVPRHIKEPALSNMLAYKVGMGHVMLIDDREGPSKNAEINRACTVLEMPTMEAYGIRFYAKDTVTNYKRAAEELIHKESAKRLNIKNAKNDDKKLDAFKSRLNNYFDLTLLIAAYPKGIGAEQHHPSRFESHIGGKNIEEKFNFATGFLGKEVKVAETFKNGEYVDVASITKGKGWQGPVKRFGTAKLYHKSTQKTRHVGTLGPFTPGKVLYTVPQAGQMGFNYRIEHNKRILKIGSKADAGKINPKSGFLNYGIVRNDYLIIEGSIPGPAKRLVRIRKSIDNRNAKGVKEPRITYISVQQS